MRWNSPAIAETRDARRTAGALASARRGALAMVLHELATNAPKYGALSWPTGAVQLQWNVSHNGTLQIEIAWSEGGGPEIEEGGKKTGFGTTLIQRAVEDDMEGNIDLVFESHGLPAFGAAAIAREHNLTMAQSTAVSPSGVRPPRPLGLQPPREVFRVSRRGPSFAKPEAADASATRRVWRRWRTC